MFLVDCAHTFGSLPIESNPNTILCFSLHKWGCFPLGAGALYVPAGFRDIVYPLVTSWHYHSADFAERFSWAGTQNTSNILTAPVVKEFHTDLNENWDGGKEMKEYLEGDLSSLSCLAKVSSDSIHNMVSYEILKPDQDINHLKQKLAENGVEVWLGEANAKHLIRLSTAPYVTFADIDMLNKHIRTTLGS